MSYKDEVTHLSEMLGLNVPDGFIDLALDVAKKSGLLGSTSGEGSIFGVDSSFDMKDALNRAIKDYYVGGDLNGQGESCCAELESDGFGSVGCEDDVSTCDEKSWGDVVQVKLDGAEINMSVDSFILVLREISSSDNGNI